MRQKGIDFIRVLVRMDFELLVRRIYAFRGCRLTNRLLLMIGRDSCDPPNHLAWTCIPVPFKRSTAKKANRHMLLARYPFTSHRYMAPTNHPRFNGTHKRSTPFVDLHKRDCWMRNTVYKRRNLRPWGAMMISDLLKRCE